MYQENFYSYDIFVYIYICIVYYIKCEQIYTSQSIVITARLCPSWYYIKENLQCPLKIETELIKITNLQLRTTHQSMDTECSNLTS